MGQSQSTDDVSTCLRVGVLGGSGLYKMPGVTNVREVKLTTPFGDPSDKYMIGKIGDVEVVFLPRHGAGHRYSPSEVNYRANIFGFKKLGVRWIIAVSAVGSLQEEIDKGDIVLVNQFIDKTRFRKDTFFGDGIVAHVPFSEPTCSVLRDYLLQSTKVVADKHPKYKDMRVHETGTYINMEGPAFSTFAESQLHRTYYKGNVIGMTAVPEAKLCREAEISYAVLAMATDYDCWKQDEEPVTVDVVIATVQANVLKAQEVIKECIPLIQAHQGNPPQQGAMAGAIMTNASLIPSHRFRALAPILSEIMPTDFKKFVLQEKSKKTLDTTKLTVAVGIGAYVTYILVKKYL